jgi:hypothetical protein
MTRSILLAFAAVCSLATLAGCAPAPFTPPSRGGAAWTETTTEHFTLYSDLAPGEAQALASDLERTFDVLADIGFKAKTRPTTHLDVVSFRREDEYHTVAPPQTKGLFRGASHDIDASSIAMFYGPLTASTRATLQHELTHAFVRQYFPRAPTWLNEGFAKYFESLAFDGEYVYIGRPPRQSRFSRARYHVGQEEGELVAFVPAFEAVPAADLLGMTPPEFYGNRGESAGDASRYDEAREVTTRYTSAWGLVHFLISSPRYSGSFATYLSNLRRLPDRNDAWERAFPAEGMPALEAEYRESLLAPTVDVLKVKYDAPVQPAPTAVPLDDAGVLAVWERAGYTPGRKK